MTRPPSPHPGYPGRQAVLTAGAANFSKGLARRPLNPFGAGMVFAPQWPIWTPCMTVAPDGARTPGRQGHGIFPGSPAVLWWSFIGGMARRGQMADGGFPFNRWDRNWPSLPV